MIDKLLIKFFEYIDNWSMKVEQVFTFDFPHNKKCKCKVCKCKKKEPSNEDLFNGE